MVVLRGGRFLMSEVPLYHIRTMFYARSVGIGSRRHHVHLYTYLLLSATVAVSLRQGSGFRVQGSGFRVQGSGFRVQGAGCRVQGLGMAPCGNEAPRKLILVYRDVAAGLLGGMRVCSRAKPQPWYPRISQRRPRRPLRSPFRRPRRPLTGRTTSSFLMSIVGARPGLYGRWSRSRPRSGRGRDQSPPECQHARIGLF